MSKCARGAGTHGDVLNEHTGTFWADTRRAGNVHTTLSHDVARTRPHTHDLPAEHRCTNDLSNPPIGICQNLLKTYLVGYFRRIVRRHCSKRCWHDLPGCNHRLRKRSADLSAGQSEFPERKIRATRKPRNDDTCVEFFDLANSEKKVPKSSGPPPKNHDVSG